MHSDGYYDSHALRVPKVPISLIGFLGGDQELVCTTLGSLTALSAIHVPNLVAHQAGASVARVLAERGEEVYRELEDECMRAALADRPAGIVSLGDGGLLHPRSRAHILSHSALVYLHYDFDGLVAKIRQRLETDPSRFHPWIADGHVCPGTLAQLFEERLPGYEEATVQIDAAGRTPIDVARELKELFQL